MSRSIGDAAAHQIGVSHLPVVMEYLISECDRYLIFHVPVTGVYIYYYYISYTGDRYFIFKIMYISVVIFHIPGTGILYLALWAWCTSF